MVDSSWKGYVLLQLSIITNIYLSVHSLIKIKYQDITYHKYFSDIVIFTCKSAEFVVFLVNFDVFLNMENKFRKYSGMQAITMENHYISRMGEFLPENDFNSFSIINSFHLSLN